MFGSLILDTERGRLLSYLGDDLELHQTSDWHSSRPLHLAEGPEAVPFPGTPLMRGITCFNKRS